MKRVIAYSGGKDSTALILFAKYNDWDFTAVFCDTGWEHPLTYAYINKINKQLLDGKLVTVKSLKYTGGMTDLVEAKGRVPSAKARFCTEHLKIVPMRDFVKTIEDDVVIYQGIRAEESPARAKMLRREWSDYYDCFVERPLMDWTIKDVFEMLKKYNVEPNPLYSLGAKRVGCFPCVMISHGELKRMSIMTPEIWDRIIELEKHTNGYTFFPPGYIPDRFCSGRTTIAVKDYDELGNVIGSHLEERIFPQTRDVKSYIEQTDQIKLFDEQSSCMSIYNLCE